MTKEKLFKAKEITKTGMYKMTDEEYFAHPAQHNSGITAMLKSPFYYNWRKQHPRKTTPEMMLGRLVHQAFLEPDVYANEIAITDCKKRGTKKWEAFEDANPGKIVIKDDDARQVDNMVDSLNSKEHIKRLFSKGIAEQAVFWFEETTGIMMKAKVDYYREDGIVVDLKTTLSAEKHAFTKSVQKYRYDIQDALYSEGLRANKKLVKVFIFCCIEKHVPFEIALYRLDAPLIERGRMDYKSILEKINECGVQKSWPGYSEKVQTIEGEKWFLDKEML